MLENKVKTSDNMTYDALGKALNFAAAAKHNQPSISMGTGCNHRHLYCAVFVFLFN